MIPTVNSDLKRKKNLSTVTGNHLLMGVDPTPEASCKSDIPQIMASAWRIVDIMNQT
jgi:hypothetical protein